MSSSIEKLYECYEVINNKDEKEENKKTAFQTILDGVSGDEKEKRLASQFISKFFKLFPDLYEIAFNKLLDLCEDDNILIRKQVIQYLPAVAKSVPEYIPKIADTLTQMLVADDNTEIMLIYAALNTVLKMDFKIALEAIFNQLTTQLDEANELINTYAFKYLNEKLSGDCVLEPEMETFIETNSRKLLTKLIGKEEYSLIIGILSYLKCNSTLIGRQKLVTEVSEQSKLLGKIDEPSKFASLISNCKQTVKLLSKNVHADDLLVYLLDNLTEMVKLSATNDACSVHEVLKCVVDISNRGKSMDGASQASSCLSGDDGLRRVQTLFQVVLDQLPAMPAEVTEEVIAALSEDRSKMAVQEASLMAMYCLCRSRPDAMAASAEMLKELKPRLQFLARVNQATNKRASVPASATVAEGGDKNGAKTTAVPPVMPPAEHHGTEETATSSRVTNNIQILVREFFKTSSSFKTVVVPSWIPEVAASTVVEGAPLATGKRPTVDSDNGVSAAKSRRLPSSGYGTANNSNNVGRRGGRGGFRGRR